MMILTVQQPWAWAIATGDKRVENRTWLTKYRGPLAIHAGARISDRGCADPRIYDLALKINQYEWTCGAILCTTELLDCHHAETDSDGDIVCCDDDWAESRYTEHGGRLRQDITHLVLATPTVLTEPLPWRGALGIRPLPDDTVAEILRRTTMSTRDYGLNSPSGTGYVCTNCKATSDGTSRGGPGSPWCGSPNGPRHTWAPATPSDPDKEAGPVT